MNTDDLILDLAHGLSPVRRLAPPLVRALLWLGVVAAIAGWSIAHYADFGSFLLRLQEPRVAVDIAATLLTGCAAIVSAFYVSVPGRSSLWLLAPLPPFALWLAASGVGCLRNGLSLHGPGGFVGESSHCFVFIVATSVPLAALLFWALRRARPIAPLPVAAMGTLGTAAIAAFILQFFHPFDVTVIDLALHLAAVAIMVLIGTLIGRPLLR